MLQDPTMGHLRFTPAEVAAVQTASAVDAERAMSTTGSAGGFAIPFTLDPSVMLTSSGALNPVRQIATVFTISTHDWKGVSSAGVTASYVAEAVEATDASPTLAQPTIATVQGRAFIPFSIEIGQDWGSLQSEMLRLIADGRDVLDATKFYNGVVGSNEPDGLRTGLTTSERVQTAGAGAFAVGDVYLLKQGLPARFIPRASFAFHPNRLDTIYRFVAEGSTTEPKQMPAGRDGSLLGKPAYEWTAIPTAVTTGTTVGIYGDFSNYYIADRLGMTAEIIPHLFGATNRFPTGQRGIYAYWRCGAKTVVKEAFRYLETL
jgi:HK97 family phage major capsid protein